MIGDPLPMPRRSPFCRAPGLNTLIAGVTRRETAPRSSRTEIRDAMPHLDLTPLYCTYHGLGKAPYRPDLDAGHGVV